MSLKPLTMLEFESLLIKAGFSDFKSNMKVAVAVSGGADSLALTILLKEWVQKKGWELVALTVDHGLRQDSLQEALTVHKILKNKGIEHHILTWNGKKPSTAIQEKARTKRYDLLETWCYDHGYDFLFLGHHQGDQNETYCMRLRRNSGLYGLACMRSLVRHQRVTLVRPFLTTLKERLQKTLISHHIKWVEDPSNKNTSFERIVWRNILKDETISLDLFQQVRSSFDGWIIRYLKAYGVLSPLGYIRLDKKAFFKLPSSFQKILLVYISQAYGVGKYPLSSSTLTEIIEKIKAHSFSATTARGLKFSISKKELLIIREYRAIKDEQPLNGRCHFIWDKRYIVHSIGMPNGIIKSIGEKGWLTLLKQDPNLKKITHPRSAIWSLPALWIEGKIHPTFNMVYEQFQQPITDIKKKNFVFRLKSPF